MSRLSYAHAAASPTPRRHYAPVAPVAPLPPPSPPPATTLARCRQALLLQEVIFCVFYSIFSAAVISTCLLIVGILSCSNVEWYDDKLVVHT
jgi:hypothetical protein